MDRFFKTLLPALVGVSLIVGCKKSDAETPSDVSTPPSTVGGASMPSTDSLTAMDFSSPEKIQLTVVPALKGMLAANPKLSGTTLDAELKGKILIVKGDVKNNDQKRAIDDVVKPLIDKAKASGINILNSAIVKG